MTRSAWWLALITASAVALSVLLAVVAPDTLGGWDVTTTVCR